MGVKGVFTESFFASYEEAFGPVAMIGFFLGPSFCIELRLGSSRRVLLSDERRSMGDARVSWGEESCMDCIIGLGIGVSFLSRLERKAFSSWFLCSRRVDVYDEAALVVSGIRP